MLSDTLPAIEILRSKSSILSIVLVKNVNLLCWRRTSVHVPSQTFIEFCHIVWSMSSLFRFRLMCQNAELSKILDFFFFSGYWSSLSLKAHFCHIGTSAAAIRDPSESLQQSYATILKGCIAVYTQKRILQLETMVSDTSLDGSVRCRSTFCNFSIFCFACYLNQRYQCSLFALVVRR